MPVISKRCAETGLNRQPPRTAAALGVGSKCFLGCSRRDDAEEGALRTIGRIIPPPCGCHKVSILGARALASCAPTNHVDVEELREVRLVWSRYNEVSDEQAT